MRPIRFRLQTARTALAVLILVSVATAIFGQATVPTPDSTPDPATEAELDPRKAKYIWDLEHITFLLETHFGDPLEQALVQRDAEALLGSIRSDFKGLVFLDEAGRKIAAGSVLEVRKDSTDAERKHVGKPEFARHLVDALSGMRTIDSVGLRVLKIDRSADEASIYRTQILLTASGSTAGGGPAEYAATYEAEFRFNDSEVVRKQGQILASITARSEIRRSSPQWLMREVTAEAGLAELPLKDNWKLDVGQTRNHRYQFAVEDYDRDGYLDILVASTDGVALLLRSIKGRRFEDVSAAMGITPVEPDPKEASIHSLASWVDLDNDKFPDLLLGYRLFRNLGGKRFLPVPDSGGLRFERVPLGTAIADFDGDGRLDLYILNQKGFRPREPGKRPWVGDLNAGTENQLWRNLGDFKFENVTAAARAAGGRDQTFAASVFFFDDDHYPDLYLANDFGNNVLLRNVGGGVFEDVTAQTGGGDFATSMGVTTGDIDNDGISEIYVANMYSKMGRRIIDHVGEDDYPEGLFPMIAGSCAGSRLYKRSAGSTRFEEVSEQYGVNSVGWAYAPAMVDLDGNGWLDLYATSGFLSYDRTKPDG